ncbi:MAG: hypothetical protein HQL31_10100, partial [Planctomycetes bacterium]|nr:hypothetical protein [Planctomycetota bacterium]
MQRDQTKWLAGWTMTLLLLAMTGPTAAQDGRPSTWENSRVGDVYGPVKAIARPRPDRVHCYFILSGGHLGDTSLALTSDRVRYMKDIGFTHYLERINMAKFPTEDALGKENALYARHNIIRSLEIHWNVGDGIPKEQRIAQGLLLARTATEENPDFNPMHPLNIAAATKHVTGIVDRFLRSDPERCLGLLLLSNRSTFSLGADMYPAGLEIVRACAVEDGILKEGEPLDVDKVAAWWNGPFATGRDWRLRKTIEEAVIARVPDMDFMVHPGWAAKIINGFSATWFYMRNQDMTSVMNACLLLDSLTHPIPAALNIPGGEASTDLIVEAHLVAICMGIQKLYQWQLPYIARPMHGGPPPKTFGDGISPAPDGFPLFSIN